MKTLRDAGVTVISGFHSPVEKECLAVLLRGTQPIIVCPARSLENMRVKPKFKKPLDEGRILFLSPFQEEANRVNSQRAQVRNRFIAAAADALLVAYAAPGGKLEELCRTVSEGRRTVYVFDSDHNRHLFMFGAIRMKSEALPLQF